MVRDEKGKWRKQTKITEVVLRGCKGSGVDWHLCVKVAATLL